MPEFPDLVREPDAVALERPRVGSLAAAERLERVQALLANSFVLGAVLAVIALGAGWFWYRAGLHEPRQIAARPRSSTVTTTAATSSTGDVIVHVSGAVARPGLYHLATGSRVIDAITAAGGATADADTDRINLAARVVDGQHVIVPRHGDPAPAEAGDGAGATSDPSVPVSLNGASAAQLEALPHVGPALARAIIDYRERHGGFKSVHELRNIRGIGERVYADLVDRVTL
jgi:competence protein ComEA